MPVLFEAQPQANKKKKSPKKIRLPQETAPSFSSPLTAYAMHPRDIRFETQGDDESVILFLRQHIIILIPKIIFGILLLFVPVTVFPFLLRVLESPIVIPAGYVIVLTVFWYVAIFGYLLTGFMHWYFNIYIVTEERIIDIDFLFLLYKKFAEARLEKIQDISFRTGGIMATVFDFGDVMIQTAGELPNFIFEKVPNPSDVVHVIGELMEQKKENPV